MPADSFCYAGNNKDDVQRKERRKCSERTKYEGRERKKVRKDEGGQSREVKEGSGEAHIGDEGGRKGGGGRRELPCESRRPPCELCSREPGHWGEVVRACLKQYTQGFSQSSHTQCARSMSLSQRSPAVQQQTHRTNAYYCTFTRRLKTATQTKQSPYMSKISLNK